MVNLLGHPFFWRMIRRSTRLAESINCRSVDITGLNVWREVVAKVQPVDPAPRRSVFIALQALDHTVAQRNVVLRRKIQTVDEAWHPRDSAVDRGRRTSNHCRCRLE